MTDRNGESSIMSPHEVNHSGFKTINSKSNCSICILTPPVSQSILKQIIDFLYRDFLAYIFKRYRLKNKATTKSLSHLIISYYQIHNQFKLLQFLINNFLQFSSGSCVRSIHHLTKHFSDYLALFNRYR